MIGITLANAEQESNVCLERDLCGFSGSITAETRWQIDGGHGNKWSQFVLSFESTSSVMKEALLVLTYSPNEISVYMSGNRLKWHV